jgi:polar amino acid transport system substrate-binding protein
MRKLFIGAVLVAVVSAACAAEEEPPPATTSAGSPTASVEACATESLNLKSPETLTIGTDQPAFQPWFAGTGTYEGWTGVPNEGTGNPASGEGFEGAFAYAVADQLGFTDDQVVWTPLRFNESYKPGPKDFDFYIGQISYLPARATAVTYSDAYYDVSQAVVANKGTPVTNATSLGDLKPYAFGVQIGTTSLKAIEDLIEPNEPPKVYDSSTDVIQALNNQQIDAYVVDAPAAYVNVLIGEAENGVVVGQLPEQGEYFGLIFEKDNPLVDCVNQAIAALKSDGTLDELEDTWLADLTFPVLG